MWGVLDCESSICLWERGDGGTGTEARVSLLRVNRSMEDGWPGKWLPLRLELRLDRSLCGFYELSVTLSSAARQPASPHRLALGLWSKTRAALIVYLERRDVVNVGRLEMGTGGSKVKARG